MLKPNLKHLILLIIASSAPFASANIATSSSLQDLSSNKIDLPWHVSRIAKEENTHCYRTTALSDDELRSAILESAKDKHLFSILEKLIQNEKGEAAVPLPHSSMDAIEATQRIFGDRQGLQLLYLFTRYRVNASHLQTPEAAQWDTGELDSLILTFSDLPEHLVPFPLKAANKSKGFQPVFRRKSTPISAGGGEVLADSAISIYDGWANKPSLLTKRILLFHEIGHNLQSLITDEQNWTNLSPWPATIEYGVTVNGVPAVRKIKVKSNYKGTHEEPFPTGYSKTQPGEDFAESVTVYRYAPDWLMERNPEKYEYLREVIFDGIEYTSEAGCKSGTKTTSKLQRSALDKAFTEFQLKLIDGSIPGSTVKSYREEKSRCDTEYLRTLSTKNHNECLSSLYSHAFAKDFRSNLNRYDEDTEDMRLADNSGTMQGPKMNFYLKMKIGGAYRASIRKAFIEDFNAYKSKKGTAAPNCNQFAVRFTNWLTDSTGKASAVVRSAIHNPMEPNVTAQFLERICKKGVETRPNYIDILEKLKGQGPLSASEFRHGIRETIL